MYKEKERGSCYASPDGEVYTNTFYNVHRENGGGVLLGRAKFVFVGVRARYRLIESKSDRIVFFVTPRI